eukprot:824983-Amphidinium_carterae.1
MPAPAPGSRPRGRAPGPNKKARLSRVATAATDQNERGLETPSLSEQEPSLPATREEEPGGSSLAGSSAGPGGPSVVPAHSLCGLCKGKFLELELQERRIRSQVLLVCSDCVTAHPKVLPRRQGPLSGRPGEKRRLARDPGEPGGSPGKRSRLL